MPLHLVFYLLSNPDPWENGWRSQRRYEKSPYSIKFLYR